MLTDSAPSERASSFTTRSKEAVPLRPPAGMVIRNGSGREAVKSLPAPSSARPAPAPPAALRSTMSPPAGAVSPAGRAAVMVTATRPAPSSTVCGSAVRATAESSS